MRAVNAQSAGCRVIRATIRMGSTAASGAVSLPVFVLSSRSSRSCPSSSVSLVTQMRRRATWIHHPPTETPRIGTLNRTAGSMTRRMSSTRCSWPTAAEPVKDVVTRQAPRSRCLGDQLASNPGAQRQVLRRGRVGQGQDLQDSRYLSVNRIGDLPAPAIGSIEPTHKSGMSTKGKPFGSKIEVVRRAGRKLRPDRTSISRPAGRHAISMRRSGLPPPRRATS